MSKAKELAEQMFPEPQMENYEDILEYRNDRDWTIIARGAFVKGYEQAKEEMMKDAVIIEDELVMCYNNGESMGLSPYKEWWETPEVQSHFNDGDKVKVIIIKE